MLIEFKVKNYKSIKDELEFSMETGENVRATTETKYNAVQVSSKLKLLKSALIFGANASGKSNFLEALYTLNALAVLEVRSVSQKLPYDSFGPSKEPTVFDITFLKNGTKYNYYVEYDPTKIYQEILKASGKEVFNRKKSENIELRENATLLFEYQEKNNKEAVEAYRWFAEDLIFEDSNFQLSEEQLFSTLENKKNKEKFLRVLQYADFNIKNIEVLDLPLDKKTINFANQVIDDEQMREYYLKSHRNITLSLTHSNETMGDFTLVLARESKGTQAAIRFILTMLTFESGKVLLFDEFDASFHLELSQTLISLINSEFQNNQFIMTSHEADLMDHKMRKDQIYFVERNAEGETRMFSLFDFKKDARSDVSNSKKYLAGRFGAVPVINDSAILDILGESHG